VSFDCFAKGKGQGKGEGEGEGGEGLPRKLADSFLKVIYVFLPRFYPEDGVSGPFPSAVYKSNHSSRLQSTTLPP
jgi:hypothetical protein